MSSQACGQPVYSEFKVQGHSAQKLKVIIIASGMTLDKSHYIFTDSWVVAIA